MPLAWAGLGFSLGLFWGASDDLLTLGLLLLLIAIGGAYLIARSASLPAGAACLLLVGLLLGAMRVGPDILHVGKNLEPYHGNSVELRGNVVGVAEQVGGLVRFTMLAEEARSPEGAWASADGDVVVWVGQDIPPQTGRSFPYLRHGDVVTVTGDLDAPQRLGAFDYPEHLAAQGIGSVLSDGEVIKIQPATGFDPMRWIHSTRESLASSIERHVPEPQAALTNALILGLRGGLTRETNDEFRAAGLSHLLAVSGLHVGVILALTIAMSARLIGRHRLVYLLPPLMLLWLYALMVGAPASAVRAGAMGSVFLLALATGRAAVPINALGLATLVMLAIDPAAMWDRSFQLSFTAMAGVLFIGLPLAQRVY